MTCFKYDQSFTRHFEKEQDGISADDAKCIATLIQEQNLGGILIYCQDHLIITYGVCDFDGVMIDYFYSVADLLEWLRR